MSDVETVDLSAFKNVSGTAVPPLQAIHLKVHLASKSPLLSGFTMDFSYFATVGSPALGDVTQLGGQVAASLTAIPPSGTNAPAKYLAPVISASANACQWEAYDVSNHLDGSNAGSPVAIGSFTMTGLGASGSCPEGSACVVTLQAPYGSDVEFLPGQRPRARDRGRIYFGPLSATLAFSSDTNSRTIMGPTCTADLTKWIKNINSQSTSTTACIWSLAVWSRAAARMKNLAEAWIDDRPDYQRRRGGQSGGKTIVTLP
jgi:hypothetical protein